MTPEYIGAALAHLRGGEAAIPLRLFGQQTAQAMRLRSSGLSYSSIAVVMRDYHGVYLSPDGWRTRCRKAGAAPVPHGIGIVRGPGS